jgi:hypothetical protein
MPKWETVSVRTDFLQNEEDWENEDGKSSN